MKSVVILFGAAGVGKTPIAEALAATFNMRLVDEWNGLARPEPGDLVVTNLISPPILKDALYVELLKSGGVRCDDGALRSTVLQLVEQLHG